MRDFCGSINCHVKIDEPMSLHSTFKVGGPADVFISPSEENQVSALISYFKDHEIPYCILGKGSNILVCDAGIRGAVIHLGHRFSGISQYGEVMECRAGTPLAQLSYTAYQAALTGIEFAWGIPGSVGGAAYMNAGAYGGEMKDILISCRHVDHNGEMGEFAGSELALGYRKSIYSGSDSCITSVKIQLKPGNKEIIKERMDELFQRRKTKQPLEYPSAGSTFKRPEGYFAAALIEQCGLKGKSVGGAMVSIKHSGFVINTGTATCNDILRLIEIIKEEVLRQTGVTLECEIRFFGCD
ncbi:UDP-N-acetylmuramate dehydrogenase [Acetanaerobacterium elongatum]|uniref:UDP-N-acetylmuramate dehydrogenase n=1 Tax=Acetanaerobacterium elongatum TaxID=258515 RepID=UPI001FA7051B|nr:UDP-N-acetylmuramate dehydrogenase [Acetanaerobacterium elongatum]